MLKKRATSGASSTPIPVNTTTSAMLSVNAVWMRSVKPCSCSYWTVAFIPRSLPSSTNARKTVTAATAPNSDGTSRRASTSMETNVTALAITNVIVVHATPRRNERPQSSELTCAPRGRGGARRRSEHLVVEGPKPLRPARGGEVVLVAPPAALAEPVAKRVVREQPVELGGERAGPRWRVEQHASLAVEDDLRDSAHLGREHGHARGTGLDERGGERVDARGVKQDVGGVEQLHDVLSVPRHDCSRAEGPQQLGDVPPGGAAANHQPAPAGGALAGRAHGLRGHVVALARPQHGDHCGDLLVRLDAELAPHRGAGAGPRLGGDAVMDRHDALRPVPAELGQPAVRGVRHGDHAGGGAAADEAHHPGARVPA